MTVTFLTRRTDHQLNNNPLIIQLNPNQYDLSAHLLKQNGSQWEEEKNKGYSGWYLLGYDIENRGKPESGGELLLSAFCNYNEEVLVIDNTSVNNLEVFSQDVLKKCFFIAHNADHEARWGAVTGFKPSRYGCTMVNDRRLLSGEQGYHFDLVSVINRRLGYKAIPQWMDKDLRSQFATCQFFTDDLILYNAADTIRLKEVYFKQLEEAERLNQQFLHRTLNSRIIIPIAEAEVTGIKHDSEKWISIAKERKEKADKLCQELTQIVTGRYGVNMEKINPALKKERESWEKRIKKQQERKLKLESQLKQLEEKGKTHLKSYKVSLEQLQSCVQLVESQKTLNVSVSENLINWGSQKQVLEVFRQIQCPLPTGKDQKTRQFKPKVSKEARQSWFVNYPDSPFTDFMKKFDSFKKIEHNIKSFGENWVQQYVRNGRAYTQFNQAGTETGRFSSGSRGQVKEYMNIQQIPSDKSYRECFIADPGRLIITADYSNCEGSIMAALANDMQMQPLLNLADSHSYLGTLCWRAVYADRYKKIKKEEWKILSETYEMNKSTPEKEKERHKFKNSAGLFPVAYGIYPNKVAATAGVTVQEGQIMIDTIKALIPNTIKFLDGKANEAVTTGYVLHNTRSGSGRWFTTITDNIKYGFPIKKSDLVEIESAARNSCVQGTNSCIIKEAIAMIECWKNIYKHDIRFLLTAHDELVYDCPEDKADYYKEKIKELMKRAAKNYLVDGITMDVDIRCDKFWKK